MNRWMKVKVNLVPCFLDYSEKDKHSPWGTGPLIVWELTHKQGNMGVPLSRGLRYQGSAWDGEVGHCPEPQGWRNQDWGRVKGSGRRCLTTEVQLCRETREKMSDIGRGVCAFTPIIDPKTTRRRENVRWVKICHCLLSFIFNIFLMSFGEGCYGSL